MFVSLKGYKKSKQHFKKRAVLNNYRNREILYCINVASNKIFVKKKLTTILFSSILFVIQKGKCVLKRKRGFM